MPMQRKQAPCSLAWTLSAAFLKGMTFKEITKETGDTLQSALSDFPPWRCLDFAKTTRHGGL
eukprot:6118168-Prorocentrum_lima.AAC.1